MASVNKDGKDSGKKSKDDGGALSKRILQELAVLRADLDALKAAQTPSPQTASPAQPGASGGDSNGEKHEIEPFLRGLREAVGAESGDAAAYVAVGYAYRRTTETGDVEQADDLCVHGGLSGILSVSDAQAARLGQALGAPQKIAIVRVLLTDGGQSAQQLEEKAQLTTGSLYHHLRELTHARVCESDGRSRYKMTELGRQTALVLLMQAGRMER